MKKGKQLEQIRHSLSHLMSMAILGKYPQTGLGVGPVIEDGFYQDYDLPESISENDFEWIEKKMRALIAKNIKFIRTDEDFATALKFYKNDPYKTELIKDLKTAGEKKVSFYDSDWYHNLCKGPHVKNTKEINPDAFKLIRIAGAYWRGDSKNKMLTRIYGVAFETKEELDGYLKMLVEAEKRDHRKIGKDLELFVMSPEAGMGLPLWTPKGTIIREALIQFLREEQMKRGYQPVVTPHIGQLELYKISGHWQHYHEMMYPPIQVKIDEEEFLLKPMNCPHHIIIFKSRPWSYREPPVRYAEFGTVYRYEKSGELSGLTRVRSFTQDDAHLFVRPDQIRQEFEKVVDLVLHVFKILDFKDYRVRLGLRDPKSDKYVGSGKLWRQAEADIEAVVEKKGLKFSKEVGEAAFYGPKLDFVVKDVLGRDWQLGTIQVDYNLPERFKLEYTDKDGKKRQPVMIHRAPFGSLERFIGILIEHFAGAFPVWLSPVQVQFVPVSEKHIEGAKKMTEEFSDAGVRVEVDETDETVGNKVRKAVVQKTPYILVIGDRELVGGDLAIRVRGEEKHLKMSKNKFLEKVLQEIKERKN